jgi:hypothetical protein
MPSTTLDHVQMVIGQRPVAPGLREKQQATLRAECAPFPQVYPI